MNNQKEQAAALLRKIQEAGFTLHELVLYLDTHPTNRKALALYQTYRKKVDELTAQYEAAYGPLTSFGVKENTGSWTWGADSWPWQDGQTREGVN